MSTQHAGANRYWGNLKPPTSKTEFFDAITTPAPAGDGTVATLANVFGWAFALWGIGLYWWAGLLYAWQVRTLLATTERRHEGMGAPDA